MTIFHSQGFIQRKHCFNSVELTNYILTNCSLNTSYHFLKYITKYESLCICFNWERGITQLKSNVVPNAPVISVCVSLLCWFCLNFILFFLLLNVIKVLTCLVVVFIEIFHECQVKMFLDIQKDIWIQSSEWRCQLSNIISFSFTGSQYTLRIGIKMFLPLKLICSTGFFLAYLAQPMRPHWWSSILWS